MSTLDADDLLAIQQIATAAAGRHLEIDGTLNIALANGGELSQGDFADLTGAVYEVVGFSSIAVLSQGTPDVLDLYTLDENGFAAGAGATTPVVAVGVRLTSGSPAGTPTLFLSLFGGNALTPAVAIFNAAYVGNQAGDTVLFGKNLTMFRWDGAAWMPSCAGNPETGMLVNLLIQNIKSDLLGTRDMALTGTVCSYSEALPAGATITIRGYRFEVFPDLTYLYDWALVGTIGVLDSDGVFTPGSYDEGAACDVLYVLVTLPAGETLPAGILTLTLPTTTGSWNNGFKVKLRELVNTDLVDPVTKRMIVGADGSIYAYTSSRYDFTKINAEFGDTALVESIDAKAQYLVDVGRGRTTRLYDTGTGETHLLTYDPADDVTLIRDKRLLTPTGQDLPQPTLDNYFAVEGVDTVGGP